MGTNHIGASFGIIQFGDDELDEIFGNGYGVNAGLTLNLGGGLDVGFSGGYVWADGELLGVELDYSAVGGAVDLTLGLNPGAAVNPYISVGGLVIRNEIEVSGFGVEESEDDTVTGYGAGGGLELQASESVLMRIAADYTVVDGEGSTDVAVGLGVWAGPRILLTLSGSYDLKEETAVAEVGFVIRM